MTGGTKAALAGCAALWAAGAYVAIDGCQEEAMRRGQRPLRAREMVAIALVWPVSIPVYLYQRNGRS